MINDIIELKITDGEIIKQLEIKEKLNHYDQMILDLTQNIIYVHPVFNHLNLYDQKVLINELLRIEKENLEEINTNALRSSSRNTNPCQQEFERDFQYIHGQYDAAIMGAAIGFTVGGFSSNPITLTTASIVTIGAVSKAIYKIAVAIDDYNDCVEEKGGGAQPLIVFPH